MFNKIVGVAGVAALSILVGLCLGDNTVDYEIRSLSGEPNYRSVNLTWEIEELNKANKIKRPKHNFTVFYCEIQTWGQNRCKSKNYYDIVEGAPANADKINGNRYHKDKQYTLLIDNLRMATKYSFHVKKPSKQGQRKTSGRDFNEDDLDTNEISESIIIPTKGFAAHATKCLSHASEIEVETGPYFGGKIASENGDCFIQGNAKDPQTTYTMHIDHKKCGSRVNHENLTVETFITVQENLGIFTHSTRRFMVLCTYHPEMLTVRASFSVPGKGGAIPMTPEWHESANGRNARERQFRLVDKTALILKENDPDRGSAVQISKEVHSKTTKELSEMEDDGEQEQQRQGKSIDENLIDEPQEKLLKKNVHFSRLVDDLHEDSNTPNYNQRASTNSTSTGILITISLSVIMCGAFVYIIQREVKKQKKLRASSQQILNP